MRREMIEASIVSGTTRYTKNVAFPLVCRAEIAVVRASRQQTVESHLHGHHRSLWRPPVPHLHRGGAIQIHGVSRALGRPNRQLSMWGRSASAGQVHRRRPIHTDTCHADHRVVLRTRTRRETDGHHENQHSEQARLHVRASFPNASRSALRKPRNALANASARTSKRRGRCTPQFPSVSATWES